MNLRSVGNVERVLILCMKFWVTPGTYIVKKGEILSSRICGFGVQHKSPATHKPTLSSDHSEANEAAKSIRQNDIC